MDSKFLIGAATAAHQVEGNNIYSDYWVMENVKHSDFAEKSLDACDHYSRYEEDIRLLAEAGCNAYRFGIEWARIEPEPGRIDMKEIDHYRNVISCCKQNGITPVVTLMHFSSPAWLIRRGGWGKEYVVGAFAKYARLIAKELGPELPYICTINEANMGLQLNKIVVDMMKAGKKGEGAVQVGQNSGLDIRTIILGMLEQGRALKCNPFAINSFLRPRNERKEQIVLRAHQAAVKAIREQSPQSKVGLTLSLFDYQAMPGGEAVCDKLWFEDYGFYLPFIAGDDFLGVQNYSRKRVGQSGALEPDENAPVTQMGYEDYPDAIGNVLLKVSESFKGELIVTENGIATDNDDRRCDFIKQAFAGVKRAKDAGVNVKGYLHWSLLDNFEWQAGYSKTFGLIAIDRSTQKRYPKKSLKVLGSQKI